MKREEKKRLERFSQPIGFFPSFLFYQISLSHLSPVLYVSTFLNSKNKFFFQFISILRFSTERKVYYDLARYRIWGYCPNKGLGPVIYIDSKLKNRYWQPCFSTNFWSYFIWLKMDTVRRGYFKPLGGYFRHFD